MAKKITRTITVYTYSFGKFNPVKMNIDGLRQVTVAYKLNNRELRRYEKEYGAKALGEPATEDIMYEMSMEDFVKYGSKVDGKSDDDNSADGD